MPDERDIINIAVEVATLLAGEPIEAAGILGRIEVHLANVRENQISIANHDAQITAARHEFLREFLIQLDGRLHRIETIAYGLDTRERSLTRLVELERRIRQLEDARHAATTPSDNPASTRDPGEPDQDSAADPRQEA